MSTVTERRRSSSIPRPYQLSASWATSASALAWHARSASRTSNACSIMVAMRSGSKLVLVTVAKSPFATHSPASRSGCPAVREGSAARAISRKVWMSRSCRLAVSSLFPHAPKIMHPLFSPVSRHW
ncbi:MAG: hypothetical protein KA072_02940 [Thermoanaerobaculaceae bacterium]|nr:hypothetical protein [Thermoanaerobaculaceae bacterium]MDI9620557.1 hypothetical protein [Acidobacteriota bacterium]HPW55204.1 hypothetical protein [Thermoanaerobaculaceae bacterium]